VFKLIGVYENIPYIILYKVKHNGMAPIKFVVSQASTIKQYKTSELRS